MDFDSAFHTRIHVSMEYSALNQAEKEAIWRWEMEKAELGIQSISNADISRLGLLELDGRTIKNVVHVLKLFRKTGSGTSTLLLDLKQVLEVATGSIPSEARRQVQDFCYTD